MAAIDGGTQLLHASQGALPVVHQRRVKLLVGCADGSPRLCSASRSSSSGQPHAEPQRLALPKAGPLPLLDRRACSAREAPITRALNCQSSLLTTAWAAARTSCPCTICTIFVPSVPSVPSMYPQFLSGMAVLVFLRSSQRRASRRCARFDT